MDIILSIIEFEKTEKNTYKVFYGGVFLSRQSLISLNKKVLSSLYSRQIFNYIDKSYKPDFFQLSYSGLVTSLRFMLEEFLKTLNPDDSNDFLSYKHYKMVLSI